MFGGRPSDPQGLGQRKREGPRDTEEDRPELGPLGDRSRSTEEAVLARVVHGLSTHGLSWVGLGWVGSSYLAFWWVGLCRSSETFQKILKLGRPLVTGKVIPDDLIMINTDN